jgi:exonuclease 3'-5' domain-containing protein 1
MASNQLEKATASLSGLRLNSGVMVVKSADDESGKRFVSLVNSLCKSSGDENVNITFDCEGVNLSRLGSVEIVSICFSASEVYLVDFGKEKCSKIVEAVKELLESSKVTKIIHDCRMDCDALYHKHGIKVNNVHDTSAFHDFIGYATNKNLNDTLSYYGIRVNVERDKSVYRSNPNFWATRPVSLHASC